MWSFAAYLAASITPAEAAEPERPISLATQLKRGLMVHGMSVVSADAERVQLERVILFPEVVRLSERKIELKLNGDEWFAVGVLETRDHGRLRMVCHVDQCLATSATGLSIEIPLVKELPERMPARGPRRGRRAGT